MIWVRRLIRSRTGPPMCPTALSATPNSTAMKMICRMSPSTNGPTTLSGTRWVMNSHHCLVSPVVISFSADSLVSILPGSALTPSPTRKMLIAASPVNIAMMVPTWK